MEKIALITGTSSGFGMLAAVELARRGYRVIATMRDPGKAGGLREHAERAGAAERIEVRQLDVTDPASIERTVGEALRAYGKIDVLVNNAGFALGGYVEDVPMDEWRRQMETNFFGLVATAKSVIPSMRERRSGKIINIGSVSGRIGFPGLAPYSASKFAVEGFSECLRHELLPFGIRVVLVEPGSYKTSIWDKGLAQAPDPAASPYADRMKAFMNYARRAAESAPDPQEVARLIGKIADDPSPRLRYPVGRGARAGVLAKALIPWKWYESVIERATR